MVENVHEVRQHAGRGLIAAVEELRHSVEPNCVELGTAQPLMLTQSAITLRRKSRLTRLESMYLSNALSSLRVGHRPMETH